MAEILGVSQSEISSWESAKKSSRMPELENLVRICEKIGPTCTLDWLVRSLGNPPDVSQIKENLAQESGASKEDIQASMMAAFERAADKRVVVYDQDLKPHVRHEAPEESDTRLKRVIEAWAGLPENLKRAIMEMVEGEEGDGKH